MSAPLERTRTPGVFKRGGRYVVRFRAPDGKVRQRSARTLAEARTLKSALTADVHRGEYRELSRVMFKHYAAQWLDTYQGRSARGIRPETIADYRKAIERHAIPYFGRRMLTEIEPMHVKAYAKHLADRRHNGKPISAGTVRLAIAPLRALFATAFEDGLIRSNPALGVRLAGLVQVSDDGEQEQVKALTEDELGRLLQKTAPEWQLFVAFVAHTGTRIGEALAIRWSDVDFGKRRVEIKRRWYRGAFAPPKSRYGRRTIPLTPAMAQALWERRKTVPAAGDDALIWPTRNGTPQNPANMHSRVLKPAGRSAGVPWVGFHTLRHTCATVLFRHGANAKQVQAWLGHHSPAFTLATYVHLMPDDAPDPAFLDDLMPVAVVGGIDRGAAALDAIEVV